MKWLDPLPTDCPACGGRFLVPVAALRSLRAACPNCGASLAAAGERMLAEEARVGREIDLFNVGYELQEQFGLPDSVILTAQTLEALARPLADRLGSAVDCEVRAAELVAEIARRVAPLLLIEAGLEMRIARLRLAYGKQTEPDAAPERGRHTGSERHEGPAGGPGG